MRNITPMEPLSLQQQNDFNLAKNCHICEKVFKTDDIKNRDHCHLTGKFRLASHTSCNLGYKNSYIIPIVFQNLSGYDSHFLIKTLATRFTGNITLLPVNKNKYISFTTPVTSVLQFCEFKKKKVSHYFFYRFIICFFKKNGICLHNGGCPRAKGVGKTHSSPNHTRGGEDGNNDLRDRTGYWDSSGLHEAAGANRRAEHNP